MKWQLFETNTEYVESCGREKEINVFYPVDAYFSPKIGNYGERQVEFDSPEEAEQYLEENKELFKGRSVYYCIPKIEK